MSISYMWEVFYIGARGLATGTGRIQQRLENVFGSYLAPRLGGSNMDLPPVLAAKAEDLMRRVTCVKASGDEGTIAATCRVMSDEEAVSIAEQLFDIFNEVCQLKAVEDHKSDSKRK